MVCVDVIVVGLGPAGATVACALAQQGHSVLAFEKQQHPRDKVCGGGLSARIERFLPNDFKEVVETVVRRVQFVYGGTQAFYLEFPQPVAYMVMRPTFDAWLAGKARAAGVVICEKESVVNLAMHATCVEVRTQKGCYRSRFVIGADGVKSIVAQHLFPGRRLPTVPALESEYHKPVGSSGMEGVPTALISLSAARKGYGWVFPKQQGLSCGVGEFVKGANRPRQSYDTFIRQEQSLAGLSLPQPLGYPLPIALKKGGDAVDCWEGQLVNGRALLVGDAGHLVDPLLGEGIYYAIRSGQLAARAVASALKENPIHIARYEEQVAKELGPEFRVAATLHRIIYGLPRWVHREAGRFFPRVYQQVLYRYCQVLQGQETYQGFWKKITDRLKDPLGRKR